MLPSEILSFLHEIEQLKCELRHSWLSNGRQESVAEHTWRLSVMAILLAPQLDTPVDLGKILQFVAIHDIAEVYVGDVPAFAAQKHIDQKQAEKESMEQFLNKYKSREIQKIYYLWQEYENQQTLEAKFVKALDKIEVRIQHNEADISTWNDIEYPRSLFTAEKFCKYDSFLQEFNKQVQQESRQKIMNESDRKIEEVEQDSKEMKKG